VATCDINTLLSDSACFSCLTPAQKQAVQLQLLCEIFNSESSLMGTVDVTDRPDRLLGHVTVDNASLCVTQCTSPWVVDVDNFPAQFGVTQVTSPWVVSVSNFPATQSVTQGTSPWVVGATDFDIRDLVFATDKVDVSGSSVLVSNFPATVAVTQSTSPWVVSATDLDIRDLVFATDKVDVTGSTVTVNQGTNPWTVSGTITVTPSGTQDVNLTKVGGTAFALGQQLSAASLPVVLTAAQLSTLTPLSTVAVTQSTSPWVVSLASTTITGTVAVTQSTSPWVVSGTAGDDTSDQTAVSTGLVKTACRLFALDGVDWDRLVTGQIGNGVTAKGILSVVPYGFNGSTYDQYQVDANKYLKVTMVGAAAVSHVILDAGSSTIGKVDQGLKGTGGDNSGWYIQGQVPVGSALGSNPVVIGGQDSTTAIRQFKLTAGGLQRVSLGALTSGADGISNGFLVCPIADNDSSGNLLLANAGYVFNGTTWDRMRSGSATGSVKVDGSGVTQPVSGTVTANQGGAPWSENITQLGGTAIDTNSGNKSAGTLRVVLATDQPQLTNKLLVTPDANSTVDVNRIAGTATAVNNGTVNAGTQRVTIASDSTGQVALATGTNAVGRTSPEATTGAVGTTTYSNTALSNTKQQVKSSAGNLYGYHFYNSGAVVTYVQIFKLPSASVTVGTTTPDLVLAIVAGGGLDTMGSVPIACGSGITIAATTTPTGSSAPVASILANIEYI